MEQVRNIDISSISCEFHFSRGDHGQSLFDIDLMLNGVSAERLLGIREKLYFDLFNFLDSLGGAKKKYFIFSCDCGDPGCGGWENGVSITESESSVAWYFEEKTDQPTRLLFPAEEYKSFADGLVQKLRSILSEDPDMVFDRGTGEKLSGFNI